MDTELILGQLRIYDEFSTVSSTSSQKFRNSASSTSPSFKTLNASPHRRNKQDFHEPSPTPPKSNPPPFLVAFRDAASSGTQAVRID
jgi:hypothetical protein